MRLWHQSLIPYLPRQQLLGQHRECAALRGAGWGRKHATVDYVFTHSPEHLVAYHYLIMDEMEKRGYKPDPVWRNTFWRGNTLGFDEFWALGGTVQTLLLISNRDNAPLYPEHNDDYLQECLDNLKSKNIIIDFKGRE
jgi:uncharacterized protein (TIGR02328 family)